MLHKNLKFNVHFCQKLRNYVYKTKEGKWFVNCIVSLLFLMALEAF